MRQFCLVNLSNHPHNGWGSAQRQAAFRLVDRIEDLAFPAVPPKASEDDVAALADACLATVPPGATHALVQGEFTLTFELVRRLQDRGIICLASAHKREEEGADAAARSSAFQFVRFRRYLPISS